MMTFDLTFYLQGQRTGHGKNLDWKLICFNITKTPTPPSINKQKIGNVGQWLLTYIRFHSPVSPSSGSRIWRKILKNPTNGTPDSCDVKSYLAFHRLDFSGYCIISWNLNLVEPGSDHWSGIPLVGFFRILRHILKPESGETGLRTFFIPWHFL